MYTPERFAALVAEFRAREEKLLGSKGGEYGSSQDRLENFHWQAQAEGRRPEEIAVSHLLKHIHAILKAVGEGRYAWAWEVEGREGLKQRFADARNYLLLVAACIDEAVATRTDCRWWSPTKPGCVLHVVEGCPECQRYERSQSA